MAYIITLADDPKRYVRVTTNPTEPEPDTVFWVHSYRLSEDDKANISNVEILAEKPKVGGMPDVIGWPNAPFIISTKVKVLMEQYGKNTYEFIPMRVKSKGDVLIDGKLEHPGFHLLLNMPEIDALNIEETDFNGGHGLEGYESKYFSLDYFFGKVVLQPKFFEGYHFWRGKGRYLTYYFCSDEFYAAVKKQNIEGWKFIKCEEKNKQ